MIREHTVASLHPCLKQKPTFTMHISETNAHLKSCPFHAPADYFTQLAAQVMLKLDETPCEGEILRHSYAERPLWFRSIPYWGVACVAVLLMVLTHVAPVRNDSEEGDGQKKSVLARATNGTQETEADMAFDYFTSTHAYETNYEYDEMP